jgi:hypothetical protein
MGASLVEAVSDAKMKPSQAYTSYDYVVVDKCPTWLGKIEDVHIVPWTWVKDCLIANRLLPESRASNSVSGDVSEDEDEDKDT